MEDDWAEWLGQATVPGSPCPLDDHEARDTERGIEVSFEFDETREGAELGVAETDEREPSQSGEDMQRWRTPSSPIIIFPPSAVTPVHRPPTPPPSDDNQRPETILCSTTEYRAEPSDKLQGETPVLFLLGDTEEDWRRFSAPPWPAPNMISKEEGQHLNSLGGLKRALSVGSSRRPSMAHTRAYKGDGMDPSARAQRLRQNCPTRASGASPSDQLHQSNFPTSARHLHRRSMSLERLRSPRKSDTSTLSSVPPGHIPSAPSSPSSICDFSLEHDESPLTMQFPRPPGRVVSGFSDLGGSEEGEYMVSLFQTLDMGGGVRGTKADLKLDSSPTLPSAALPEPELDEDLTPPTPTYSVYRPPSPALTPSPHSSLRQSPILETPMAADRADGSHHTPPRHRSSPGCDEPQGPCALSPLPFDSSPLPKSPREALRSLPSTSSHLSLHHSSVLGSRTQDTTERMSSHGHVARSERNEDESREASVHTLPTSHPFHPQSNTSPPHQTATSPTLSPLASQPFNPPTSPPATYISRSSASSNRRYSRFTTFSGSSSASSIHSGSDTSSLRHGNPYHWGIGEKPDISTVFEEETAEVDIDLVRRKEEAGLDQRKAPPKDASTPHNVPLPPLPLPPSATSRSLRHHASGSTLVDRSVDRKTDRSGAKSPSSTTGSTRSTHPFASAVIRPTSPPPSNPAKSGMSLSTSRSQMSLGDGGISHLPVLSSSDVPSINVAPKEQRDEPKCPICVEPLDYTFRLQGEQPPVTPDCGHALHAECFEHVYGKLKEARTKHSVGVCGVCRQSMRIVDAPGKVPGQASSKKLAQISGNSREDTAPATGRKTTKAIPKHEQDDELEVAEVNTAPPQLNRLFATDKMTQVVVPRISIKSEFSSISPSKPSNKAQLLTAMVSITMPSTGERGRYNARPRQPRAGLSASQSSYSLSPYQLPPSPQSSRSAFLHPPGSSFESSASPFANVIEHLQKNVVDYKASGLDQLGSLRLYDVLHVRKGSLSRPFNVYLFQDALICIGKEKKTGLRKLFSSGSSTRSQDSSSTTGDNAALALKGRIYLKHVSRVIDSTVGDEFSITIMMVDEHMDSFILCFKDQGAQQNWKTHIMAIVDETRSGQRFVPSNTAITVGRADKIAKLMGDGAPKTISKSASMPFSAASSTFMDLASPHSIGNPTPATSSFGQLSPLPRTSGDKAYIAPLGPVHTALDLIIVISLPAADSIGGASQSTHTLKSRLMRETLSFVLASLGSQDRVSIVTCEMGVHGAIRKTPFLNPTRYQSRSRLEAFVEKLGTGFHPKDEFLVAGHAEEKSDVVTAMNVALDVVLQRHSRNPLSGMILLSDTSDSIKRAQMELVTARLDASNIPVHAVGYGRGHDPSPLWMISNHTQGTYTFVKEWAQLRDTFAGIIGGMMSIAITNMKVHLSCQDYDFRILKVSGSNQAVVSSSGNDVDIDLRELRHGETREVLIEFDLDGSGADHKRSSGDTSGSSSDLGGSDSSASGNALGRISRDNYVDELPVTELNCSWFDPFVSRSITRLSNPYILTVAITPKDLHGSPPPNPAVVRRRMEVLASDMITRALLIASRKNYAQSAKILAETRKVIEQIADHLKRSVGSSSFDGGRGMRVRHELNALVAVNRDLAMLVEGLEEEPHFFERDHRNFAAQQAVVLRSQRSWTQRTPCEILYCTPETAEVIDLSGAWMPE